MTMQKFYELTKELSWDRSISDSQWVLVGAVGKVWLSPKRVEVLYASKDGYTHDCSQIVLEDITEVEVSRGYLRIKVGKSSINVKI